ncbi:molybdopterin-dependent oxidoreductase [Salisediminibacterium beveridgei]|uniref:Molybdopterin oxidoreductase n=1 Tax=Salisediminibacterium beveridgei TaxID=632773 RepID=A0A1D7QX62_9BACI|nr:molybdopterin-dependent oxidoreductase [Salisediminibacterium beveridgei]AOM83611.1 molybdopterin oxidoreductase [Salisediminibacterium beveridgei]
MNNQDYRITHHACPRNCYGSCGIIAYSADDRLMKIEGDPDHEITSGKLCPKAYLYVKQVYDPSRLKYPLRQVKRGSGEWERISWQEAYETIAAEIIRNHDLYESNLSLCLTKYSGNFGVVHNSVDQFFNGIGPITKVTGSPCWSAGLDGHLYDFGDYTTSDPANMRHANVIILWGVNPVWTAPHMLKYITEAREKGATVIVIDPILTKTAERADLYIQIPPGEDGAFATLIAKRLIETGKYDEHFINRHTLGFEAYRNYLKGIAEETLLDACDLPSEIADELLYLMAEKGPVFIWQGFGLQRHTNGGQNIRTINALAALTGNIGKIGTGTHFAHQATWSFTSHRQHQNRNRSIPVARFAESIKQLDKPPVDFLWVSSRNFMAQDADVQAIEQALKQVSMIVVVDTQLTATAKYADIVLPTTTFFEEEDVVASYWHHLVSFNEKAIEPYYESKSDFTIACELSKLLNEKRPGFSRFQDDLSIEGYIDQEFNDDIYDLLKIDHWSELIGKPKEAEVDAVAWQHFTFKTPSGKFEFFSESAREDGHPALPEYKPSLKPSVHLPYWLLTPHTLYSLNSQVFSETFTNHESLTLYVSLEAMNDKGLSDGDFVKLYNDQATIPCQIKLNPSLPRDIVVILHGSESHQRMLINQLIPGYETDMGDKGSGAKGIAFNDVFVNFSK